MNAGPTESISNVHYIYKKKNIVKNTKQLNYYNNSVNTNDKTYAWFQGTTKI